MRKNGKLVLLVLVTATVGSGLEWRNSPPPARNTPTMAVDTATRRVIMFGGFCYENSFNDAWEMPLDTTNGYRWMPLTVSGTPPSGRCRQAMAYDPEHERMIIFGGNDASGVERGDFWALDLTPGSERWESLSTTGPALKGRTLPTAAYCLSRHSMLFYGGAGGASGGYGETYELNLSTLELHLIAVPDSGPGIRCACGSFYDPDSNRLIIVGGVKNDFYNDVWALDLTAGNEHWTQLPISGDLPTVRAGFATGWIPSQRRLYVFGGWSFEGLFNDLWYLDFAQRKWYSLSPSGRIPAGRRNPAGAYDPFNGNLLVFGGESWDGYCDDSPFIHVFDASGMAEWHAEPQTRAAVYVPTVTGGAVRIRYTLPCAQPVTVKVMDPTGRVARTLFKGDAQANGGWLTWDGCDAHGRRVAAGSYLCVMVTKQDFVSARFALIR